MKKQARGQSSIEIADDLTQRSGAEAILIRNSSEAPDLSQLGLRSTVEVADEGRQSEKDHPSDQKVASEHTAVQTRARKGIATPESRVHSVFDRGSRIGHQHKQRTPTVARAGSVDHQRLGVDPNVDLVLKLQKERRARLKAIEKRRQQQL